MNLRLKLVRYFVLGGVFRIPSVYLIGETEKKARYKQHGKNNSRNNQKNLEIIGIVCYNQIEQMFF